jgi:hypothetical protein
LTILCVAAERGVSLVELLGGVLILGLIVTVVTRVYGADTRGAESASLTKMRYLHRAVQLYRAEWAGEMPSRNYVHNTWMGYSQSYFESPCLSFSEGRKVSYIYPWIEERRYALDSLGSKAPVFIDLDCNPNKTYDHDKQNLVLAVLLDGTTAKIKRAGDPRSMAWWLK